MLETVREFGLERLAERAEEPGARAAQAAFMLEFAETAEPLLLGVDQSVWLARLDAEQANLRAALAWLREQDDLERALRLAGALGHFWRRHCHFAEGRQWLKQLLTDAETAGWRGVTRETRARALSAAGMLAWAQGDFSHAESCHRESLALCEAAGDERGVAFSLYNLANQAKMQGDLARAAELYEQSLARFRALADDWGIALLWHAIGLLRLEGGDVAGAEPLLAGNVQRARRVGDRWLLAAMLGALGQATARLGDFERAEPLLAEALTLFRDVGERRWSAHVRSFQGLLALWRHDRVAAFAAFSEALRLARELGVRFYIAEILERLGALLVASNEATRAARLLGAAATLREAMAAPPLPVDRAIRDEAAVAAREMLGGRAFAEAWQGGQAAALSEVIEEVLALEFAPAPESATKMVVRAMPALSDSLGLTPRECEILGLLCQRLTDKEIAEQLFISRRTSSSHVLNILGKLGAANRREAAAFAAAHGLLAIGCWLLAIGL